MAAASPFATDQQAAELYLPAYQLGRQQRSDYWLIMGASWAAKRVVMALECGTGQRATAEAALAALQDAAPALRRCKKLPPVQDVQQLEAAVVEAQQVDSPLRSQLQHPASSISTGGGGDSSSDMFDALGDCFSSMRCNGCRKHAVGLRKCSRCRRAAYCRQGWCGLQCCTTMGVRLSGPCLVSLQPGAQLTSARLAPSSHLQP